jgi:hypothetical protein
METIVKVRYEELKGEFACVSTTPRGELILSLAKMGRNIL